MKGRQASRTGTCLPKMVTSKTAVMGGLTESDLGGEDGEGGAGEGVDHSENPVEVLFFAWRDGQGPVVRLAGLHEQVEWVFDYVEDLFCDVLFFPFFVHIFNVSMPKLAKRVTVHLLMP